MTSTKRCIIRHKAATACTIALSALAWMSAVVGATAQDILTTRATNRQQMILDGAKKEGRVVLYSAAIVNQAQRPLAAAFMKKYPFVKMTFWRGDTEEIIAKVSAELRAKNLVADLVEGTGVGEVAVEANLTQPYFSPEVAAMPTRYHDPRGNWTSTRVSYYGIAYNTRAVPTDQVPKTYDDLLDPRWRSKLAWRIGTSTGTPLFLTNIRLSRGEEKAKEYFRKLATQKVINFGSGSARTLVDRVIAGEFPIALNIFAHHPLISRAKGAPVNSQLMDPVPSTTGTMIIPRGVRNPHASLLLADFILSREGQEILSKAEYFPVRSDVPPQDVLASVIPDRAGVPERFVSSDQLNHYTESSVKIFDEMFR
jgi:ABC-type Fe3+ transport system substrate-binding protein